MRASTAAGLVGAAMLSTLVFPFVGLALRRHEEADREPHIEDGTGRGLPSARRRARRPPATGGLDRRFPTGPLLPDQLQRLVDGGLGPAGLDRLLEQQLRLRLHRGARGGLDPQGELLRLALFDLGPRRGRPTFLRVSMPCSERLQVAPTLVGQVALTDNLLPFSVAGPTRLDLIRLSSRAPETPPAPPPAPLLPPPPLRRCRRFAVRRGLLGVSSAPGPVTTTLSK